MKIVVIGATSAIAEHCCRLWLAEGPAELIMVARDMAKAERIAADLRVRGPGSTISIVKGEFHDPAGIASLVAQAAASGPIDVALIAQGWLADQQKSQDDLAFLNESLQINAVSPALYAEAFARHFVSVGPARSASSARSRATAAARRITVTAPARASSAASPRAWTIGWPAAM